MANLSKEKRDRMIGFLEHLKREHMDDESIRAFTEIENHLRDKKYGLVWEEHSERIDEMLDENIPIFSEDTDRKITCDIDVGYNFILEGDNLQSLYLLEKTHKGLIDVIYIDPPYNRGKDDFVYNDDYIDAEDSYKHSKWVSFMSSRLKIARDLLAAHGTIFISIDDNEIADLKLLCDEIFDEKNYLGLIHWRRRSNQPNDKTKLIGLVAEYILVYCKELNELKRLGVGKVDLTGEFSNSDNDPRGPWATKAWKTGSGQSGTRYDITVPSGRVYNEEWMGSESTYKKLLDDNRILFTNGGDGLPRKKYYKYEREEEGQCATNWWGWEEFGSNNNATDELKALFDGVCPFDNPKPTKLIESIIKLGCVKKDALILDFFGGSGTTAEATIHANEDGGKRRFIICTNNEVNGLSKVDYLHSKGYLLDYNPGSKTKESTIANKIQRLIESTPDFPAEILSGEEYENYGICKRITYPRIKAAITGVSVAGEELFEPRHYNVKYFKCDWTPRKPEEYLLSNALCLHIREMIELQNGIGVENRKNVLILNRSDFRKYVMDDTIYAQIENIWVNQNIIFNSLEMEKLNALGFKYIPREFFGQELREAAE